VAQHRRRASVPGDRGGAVIELAILFPAIILVVFGAVQIAVYYTARTLALTAAQAAVSAERQHDAEPGDGQEHAQEFLAQAGDWLTNAEVSDPVYTGGQVGYVVTGTAITLVPGITWEIQQTAHGTREEFTTP
jgi:Flp pilus assembly protein TadG